MSRHLGTDPSVEKMARAAKRQGFSVIISGNNHLKWYPPKDEQGHQPAPLITPLTYGDKRRIKRVEKFLRTHGVDF